MCTWQIATGLPTEQSLAVVSAPHAAHTPVLRTVRSPTGRASSANTASRLDGRAKTSPFGLKGMSMSPVPTVERSHRRDTLAPARVGRPSATRRRRGSLRHVASIRTAQRATDSAISKIRIAGTAICSLRTKHLNRPKPLQLAKQQRAARCRRPTRRRTSRPPRPSSRQ